MPDSNRPSQRSSLRYRLSGLEIGYTVGGEEGRATLVDVSTGGCAVRDCSSKVVAGKELLITLPLPQLDRPLVLEAVVIRAEDTGFTAEFTAVNDSFRTTLSTLLAQTNRNRVAAARKEE
jgi:hypothetical protein